MKKLTYSLVGLIALSFATVDFAEANRGGSRYKSAGAGKGSGAKSQVRTAQKRGKEFIASAKAARGFEGKELEVLENRIEDVANAEVQRAYAEGLKREAAVEEANKRVGRFVDMVADAVKPGGHQSQRIALANALAKARVEGIRIENSVARRVMESNEVAVISGLRTLVEVAHRGENSSVKSFATSYQDAFIAAVRNGADPSRLGESLMALEIAAEIVAKGYKEMILERAKDAKSGVSEAEAKSEPDMNLEQFARVFDRAADLISEGKNINVALKEAFKEVTGDPEAYAKCRAFLGLAA